MLALSSNPCTAKKKKKKKKRKNEREILRVRSTALGVSESRLWSPLVFRS
jgi:hypothetical protein